MTSSHPIQFKGWKPCKAKKSFDCQDNDDLMTWCLPLARRQKRIPHSKAPLRSDRVHQARPSTSIHTRREIYKVDIACIHSPKRLEKGKILLTLSVKGVDADLMNGMKRRSRETFTKGFAGHRTRSHSDPMAWTTIELTIQKPKGLWIAPRSNICQRQNSKIAIFEMFCHYLRLK